MNTKTLMQVAEKFGVPTAFCTVLCTAIWFSVRWTAQEVIKPVISGHVSYLKAEQEDRKEMKDALIRQTDILVDIKEYQKDIRDDQRKFPAVAERMP